MKTNVTCSLDADLVARLDAWRASLEPKVGRGAALERLLEGLPDVVMTEEGMVPVMTDVALRADGCLVPVEPEGYLPMPEEKLKHVIYVTQEEPETVAGSSKHVWPPIEPVVVGAGASSTAPESILRPSETPEVTEPEVEFLEPEVHAPKKHKKH